MTQAGTQQAIQEALQHHQAGRLAQAEAVYRQVLQLDSHHADALHLLGVLSIQSNNPAAALELIHRAISANPNVAAFYGNLGVALDALGRREEAIAAWQKSLVLHPNYVETMNNLGRAMDMLGRHEEAIAYWVKAIAVRPDFADAYNNLALARMRQKQLAEAVKLLQRAIELNPNYAEAYQNLAGICREQNRTAEAVHFYQRALRCNPGLGGAWFSLGEVLRGGRRFAEAQAAYEQALTRDANVPEIHHSIGLLYREQERFAEAELAYRKAVALKPGQAEWLSNIGTCIQEMGRLDEALALFDQSLLIQPEHPGIHFNRALVLFLLGRLSEAWMAYAYRLKCPQFHFLQRQFSEPAWEGQNLENKRLLLYDEQGFGDAVQFVRFAEPLAKMGAKVILEAQSPIMSLLATASGIEKVIQKGEAHPEVDFQVSLLDVPRVLAITPESIPASVPYLYPKAEALARWKKLLAPCMQSPVDDRREPPRLNVGLVWAGNPLNSSEWKRSMRLNQFAPLAGVPGVRFFSLQKGPPAAQLATAPPGLKMIDFMPQVRDFMDTAAFIYHLDLVIGVDTSVIHLAGALAKPVWTLLPYCPDWRWMMHRPDTPWYPTMRLFRQPGLKQWDPLIAEVTLALRGLIEERRGGAHSV